MMISLGRSSQPPEAQLVKVGIRPSSVTVALRLPPFPSPLQEYLPQASAYHPIQFPMHPERAMIKVPAPSFQTPIECSDHLTHTAPTGSGRKLADLLAHLGFALFPGPLIAPLKVPAQELESAP
ncbi:MAG TPA: hypothetical protein VF988_05605, partial [Verrucomicrobiae bacterium]